MNKFIVRVRHDKGTVNITTWASSLEAAKRIVMVSEGCPESAILKARYAPLTVSELRSRIEASRETYYFTKGAMKFFGDTMANFGVRAEPVYIETRDGEKKLCWELYRRKPVKNGLQSSAFFSVDTYERVRSVRD